LNQSNTILKSIRIDGFSATPKYLQLCNCIIDAIRKETIKKGDLMPSINEISFELEVSRVTVERGYNYLKSLGILKSIAGKGFFINSVELNQKYKVFLLFNKLSTHKKIIYDAFVETLGPQASIDFYIYNNDYLLFKKLIEQRHDQYTHYVIIPHFKELGEHAHEVINQIGKGKLILLDKLIPNIKKEFGAIFQNFENDIFNALKAGLEALKKYEKLVLVFPENSYCPVEILNGFYKFCAEYAFDHQIVSDLASHDINSGEAYINLMEDDLVTLLEKIKESKMLIGEQIGLISYNETPLKRFILDGISTISTDFKQMGVSAANLIINDSTNKTENPFYFIARKSL
jgi:DNA-binding transcriptional regulator YhcF (GntR family)